MSQSHWYLDLTGNIVTGMGERTNPIFNGFQEEVGGFEDFDFFFLQVAHVLAPEPITPQEFIKRAPYTRPEYYDRQMDEAVERGWLEVVGPGQYAPSAKGRDVAQRFFDLLEKTLANLETVADDDLLRIAALLSKVVAKAHALPEPAEKPILAFGRRLDRGPSAPPLIQARRQMFDLLGYRDDVHVAAWQPYETGGQKWEVLTYVWRGDANTGAELAEKLAFRSYDEASYAAALQDLVSRGWIAERDAKYVTTEQGSKLRQEAEDATDRYYAVPWAALDDAETQELKDLLEKMAEAVKPSEQEPA